MGEAHACQLWKEIQRDALTMLADGSAISERVLGAPAREVVSSCADYQALIRRPLQIGCGAIEISKGLVVMKADARPLHLAQRLGRDHTCLHWNHFAMQWITRL